MQRSPDALGPRAWVRRYGVVQRVYPAGVPAQDRGTSPVYPTGRVGRCNPPAARGRSSAIRLLRRFCLGRVHRSGHHSPWCFPAPGRRRHVAPASGICALPSRRRSPRHSPTPAASSCPPERIRGPAPPLAFQLRPLPSIARRRTCHHRSRGRWPLKIVEPARVSLVRGACVLVGDAIVDVDGAARVTTGVDVPAG